jgi:signal transduction histidine kinase
VALHQGEVFVESLEGVGSRFVVRLPMLASVASVPSVSSCDAA